MAMLMKTSSRPSLFWPVKRRAAIRSDQMRRARPVQMKLLTVRTRPRPRKPTLLWMIPTVPPQLAMKYLGLTEMEMAWIAHGSSFGKRAVGIETSRRDRICRMTWRFNRHRRETIRMCARVWRSIAWQNCMQEFAKVRWIWRRLR